MGRRAGVTSEQTRAELLAAAARVFAAKGYDGATIADITVESGRSSGAIYAHYASKAELFGAVLESHFEREYLLAREHADVRDIADFVAFTGSSADRRASRETDLFIEAIMASKRDPEVAELVTKWLTTSEGRLARSIEDGQAAGLVHRSVDARALGRFITMVALGSFLTAALDVDDIDHADWTRLITQLVGAMRAKDPSMATTAGPASYQAPTNGHGSPPRRARAR